MNRIRRMTLGILGFAPLSACTAQADIVEVGGAVVLATPPWDITNGQWTSDTEIRGWFERERTLASDLILDHVNTGLVNDAAQLATGTVAAGTTVGSYIVRLDPSTGGSITLSGFVVFDTPILGVLQDRPTLGDTDDDLGRPCVMYNGNNNRGMELGSNGGTESFQISADRLQLDFSMTVTSGPTDDIRIVTAAVAGGGPPCGDFDGDGAVTQTDLGILLADYGCDAGIGNCPGDTDNDGDTDQADLGVVLASYCQPCQ